MSDPDEDGAHPRPIVPRRTATAAQAVMAIALVFLVGVIVGFVLARTL